MEKTITKTTTDMTLQEAIVARHSVRQYLDKPIEAGKIQQLQDLISECNREGGLHIQLITNEPNAFAGGLAKYGRFSGISNYIAMICKKGDDVNLGYYGERVVLLAQTLGLNTCWVGLTFRKQPDQYEVLPDEKLVCVVSLGYGANQGVPHPQKKGFEAYCRDDRSTKDIYPEWFVNGMKAALLAPTAINQQKFEFILHDGNKVKAKTRFTMLNGYAPIDLGIAKCNFEIGAGKENFEWQ
jgi:nitroreductase